MRARASWLGFAAVAVLSGLPRPARAQLVEPSGLLVPQAVSARELIDVENTQPGYPPEAVTLPALFAYRGEAIDYELDASTEPAVFSPLCSFSGTLVLRGGGCKVTFGWYNALAGGGAPPAPSEIYPLIPNDDPDVYGAGAFTPLAIAGPWTPKTFTAENIRADARYAGGLIGFALVGDGLPDCTQTKFSQRELNTVCTSCSPNAPWITTIVYRSTAVPDAYYLAFEDLPMSPTDFTGYDPALQPFRNDGDFNDFVFFITGLVCEGGGEPCDTGLLGACAVGRSDCSVDGSAGQCRRVLQPGPESCDNVDNDCNGRVDDGELCPAGEVCDRGNCVPECGTAEFRCAADAVCERGFCIEPACRGVSCEPGEACRAGACVGACQGVVCPLSQECQLGRCVDPCGAVSCEAGQVCEQGLCVASCGCRDCGSGRVCAADGRCVDAGCEAESCGAHEVCAGGVCTDACSGARCPGQAACLAGKCADVPPFVDPGGAGSGGGLVLGGGGLAGAGGTSGAAGASGANQQGPRGVPGNASSCACRAGAEPRSKPLLLIALGGLAGLGLLRVRRRRAHQLSARAQPLF